MDNSNIDANDESQFNDVINIFDEGTEENINALIKRIWLDDSVFLRSSDVRI